MAKVIGNTVGTTMSPSKLQQKLKPVKTVNGQTPDANGNVEIVVKDGYTPVKGEDYYTPEEKAEFENLIADEVAKKAQLKPEFVQSVAELEALPEEARSKLYALPDNRIYAYMYTEKEVGGYTDLADTTSADWWTDSRLDSSGNQSTGATGRNVTNYIHYAADAEGNIKIRIKNATIYTADRFAIYDANKTRLYFGVASSLSSYIDTTSEAADGITILDITKLGEYLTATANGSYIRLPVQITDGATPIITVNEEITEGTVVKEYAWTDTGHKLTNPANYEDDIINVTKKANKNETDIVGLQGAIERFDSRLTSMEEAEDDTTDDKIPEYWQEHLAVKIASIKALQDEGGKDCFSFAVITDIHYEQNLAKLAPRLAKKICDECGIKYVLILGDCGTRNGILKDLDYINKEWDSIETMIAPIRDRLLITDGNHDGSYGATDGDGDGVIDDVHGTGNSAFNWKPQKKYSRIKRKVSLVDGVTFDESGCGYYADDKTAKVRYIVLSTHNNKYEENADGSSKYSNMNNFRYGQSQFDLVIKALNTLEEGWSVLVASHVPLDRSGELLPWGATAVEDNRLVSGEVECWIMADVLNAYVNRTAYTGSFTGTQDGFDAVSVNVNFANAKGTLIGYFGGHVHKDGAWGNTYTWDGRLKQCDFWTITTRCDGHNENDSTLYAEKVSGTDTEQSFEVYTVNRATGKLYGTKIGAGANRDPISY